MANETHQPITEWLHQASAGDPESMDRLYAAVYPVLHRMASGKMGVRRDVTLTPTVVINELFLKISDSSVMNSTDRNHFYAACSRAMRFIVADFARNALSQKRGGKVEKCSITSALVEQPDRAQEILDIDSALNDLESIDGRLQKLIKLKFFDGLNYTEIGSLHNRSERSIKRDWVKARAFLVARSAQLAT